MTLQKQIKSWAKKEETALLYKRSYRVEHYTYKELVAKARSFITQANLKKKQKVLLWGTNAPEWIIVYLACAIQGAIVIPIDAASDLKFVQKVRKETSANLLCTDKNTNLKIKTYHFSDLDDTIKQTRKHPRVLPQDILQIVYTSGTTSKPKGVVLTHENITTNVASVLKVLPLRGGHRILATVPLSHLLGQSAMLTIFSMGATLSLVRTPTSRNVVNMLNRKKHLALVCVPKILENLKGRKIRARLLISGGAPLDPELEAYWDRRHRVIQGYGLTETSPVIAYNDIFRKRKGSVGKVIPGVEVKIHEGEVYVKGKSVFKRYYKNKQKTKEAFDRGWFKTGDTGFLRDGHLYLKGRSKDVIVTPDGLNVHPHDVESKLKLHPKVKDAAVVGFPKGKEQVYAILVTDHNPKKIIEEVNKQLESKERIQGYAVWPGTLPRTPTKKVQKFKLIEFLKTKKVETDPITKIVEEITKKKANPKKRLAKDLKLSSLDRVELLARLEEELHIDLDDAAIGPDTTLADLKNMQAKKRRPIRRWMNSTLAQVVRACTQPFFALWTKYYCKLTIKGTPPSEQCLIVANHASHFDTAVIMLALPSKIRRKLAVAVWAEYFEKPSFLRTLQYYLGPLVVNGFPFPQKSGFRQAFDNAGELVDNGHSILLFPEGERTKDGKMHKFKPGVGLLAPALNLPVVPVKIEGLFEVWPRNAKKQPGNVTVTFGDPIDPQGTTLQITKDLEKAVRRL